MKNLYSILWKEQEVGKIFGNDYDQYKFVPETKKFDEAIQLEGMPKFFINKRYFEWGALPSIVKERIQINPNLIDNCRVETDSLQIKRF